MYYAIRIALLLARRVSKPTAYRACELLGPLFWLFNGRARRTIEYRLRRVVGADVPERRIAYLSRRAFVHQTKDYYDLLLPACVLGEDAHDAVTVHGFEHIRQARRDGFGVVAVPFHMAGFNLAVQSAVGNGFPAAAVSEPLQPLRLRRLVDDLRSSLGLRLIPASSRNTRTLLRALRQKDVLVIAGDRTATGTGVPVSLFGAQAMLPAAPAVLALRTGARIVPALHRRTKENGVHMSVMEPISYSRTNDFDSDVAGITQQLADIFEPHIASYPEQWVVAEAIWKKDGAEPPEGNNYRVVAPSL